MLFSPVWHLFLVSKCHRQLVCSLAYVILVKIEQQVVLHTDHRLFVAVLLKVGHEGRDVRGLAAMPCCSFSKSI